MNPPLPVVSRLAPTPSGHLHRGNALNFILTWVLTRRVGGRLWLRIDDMDRERCRPEYVESIFRDLDWLGLEWDEGPNTPDQFERQHAFHRHRDAYRQEVMNLWQQGGPLFACTCSRRQIQQVDAEGAYPGFCRDSGHSLRPGDSALRLRLDCEVTGWERGDPVLWTRDDNPAYQLASLLADRDMGVNLVVRGEDLAPSTALQRSMAPLFGAERFAAGRFVHHPLLVGEDGEKLSKSRNAPSLRDRLSDPLPLLKLAAGWLGVDPQQVGGLGDLVGG
ncbi:MAG: tRNA glutamyl-Q synthetase [Alphaproteobacteria bacterium CG_4_10_14_0_2_um_filter_63_37]|nr:MAG: hypothetical protein AUJ55_04290 [Proteobacteria bacterium CG1_02_64_396]PJA24751.1 MAG: tRNA glutamyl-Q synthetase [Alphaproteobacteria bacterium CG_4_10_14_0_2_um_filter_63_37]